MTFPQLACTYWQLILFQCKSETQSQNPFKNLFNFSESQFLHSVDECFTDKPLSVFAIGTRRDLIDKNKAEEVKKVMAKVSDNLEGKLDMHTGLLMDARDPTSSEMVELRKEFAEVARDILRVRTHGCLLQQTVIYDNYIQQ